MQSDITQNTINIEQNTTGIDQNTLDIATNTNDIEQNTIDIATNANAITAIQTVNTTQDARLTNVESVNTTQTSNISANTSAITATQAVNTTPNTNISNNTNAITAIQTVNATQTTGITAIQGVNTTQTTNIATNASAITAIQAVNTTQSADITAIQTKTNKLTVSGSILDINNTSTEFRLNQNLNVNNNNITNVSNITLTGYSGLMQAYPSSTSMFNFESVLLGDATNGSGFNFKCIKGGANKNLSVDYNTVNFNTRTLTNCTTIDTINTTATNNYNALDTRINTLETSKIAWCKLLCNASAVWSMSNNNGAFRAFVGGTHMSKLAVGRVSVLIDINTGINSTNFSVTGTGTFQITGDRDDIIWIMPGVKSAYYSSGIIRIHSRPLFFP